MNQFRRHWASRMDRIQVLIREERRTVGVSRLPARGLSGSRYPSLRCLIRESATEGKITNSISDGGSEVPVRYDSCPDTWI